MNTGTAPNGTNMLFNGVYANPEDPLWAFNSMTSPANLEVSTLTVNSYPAGNILLTHNISSAVEYNAPLLFQRPPADINAPVEALVMNTSVDVPTKPIDGEYITALKTNGTVYDDIAVAGLQIFGNQTIGSPAVAYINGLANGDLNLSAKGSVYMSSLYVSSLFADTIVSTTSGTATSYTATQYMSTPIIYTDVVAAKVANISTINVSTLNAPNFVASTLSTVSIDAKFTLTSTLSLTGNPTNIDLGLGDVIQGLVGGAATQALGAGLGGAGLITGTVALVTGRTSGGVNSNVFQTVNGATQLQFSTIGSAVSSIFLTVNSPNPLTTPGLETRVEQGVPAGTYCVRSVGDPLYITNNVSSIQMLGQWVPVIQPTATIPALAISSLNVSSVNNAPYPPPGSGGGIPSTLAISTATINGNFTQSGVGTFNWGGNTMSPFQVVLARPTSVNNTLTTSGGAFLNAGATVNNGFTVASGPTNLNTGLTVGGGVTQMTNSLTVFGQVAAQAGLVVNGGNAQFNGPAIATNTLTANGLATFNGGVRSPALSTINISTNNIDVNTINNAPYPPPGGGGIPSTLALSTATINGNFTQSGAGTFNWGGNTMSPTQVVLSQPTSVNNTFTTASGAFLNAGATVNNTLTVASGGVVVNGSGISISNGGLFVNNATTLNGGLTAFGTATFQNQANFNQNANVSGFLTVNSGIGVSGGLNVTTGNFTMNQFGASANVPILNATATVRSPAISTINISTNNINVNTINNAAYPPPVFFATPSTLNASTINVNGGQTITNGGLAITGGGLTVAGGAATMNNSLTVLGQTFAVGGLVVEPPGAIFNGTIGAATTIQVAGLATLNGGVITPALSTNTISSASLFISSINNAPYPPGGSGGIPSTLNASTLNVNGGFVVNNGNANISTSLGFNNSGFIGGSTDLRVRLGGAASKIQFLQLSGNNDAVIVDMNSDKTTRFYSTLVVRDSPFPSLQPSQASIRTYTTTDPVPYGSVITSNVSTFNIASQYATISTISTSFLSSGIVTASNIGCFNFSSLSGSINTFVTSNVTAGVSITTPSLFATNIQASNSITSLNTVTSPTLSTININLSTVNGIEYPPPPAPSPFLVPTGSVTVWAGGSDSGAAFSGGQNFAVPAGWLACDGMAVSQVTYFALYSVIGNKFSRGVVPNPGLFFLPDLTFAVPMGTPYRNYFTNDDLTKPNFQIQFQEWSSTYVSDPSETCWKILQTNGGTLNLGTKFMGDTVSFSVSGPWPNIYVTKILQYDGYQGYIIVRNENNLLPVPTNNGATLTITANGVVDRFPTTTGDYIYTLGTPGVFARNTVTHNQTAQESATHSHGFGSGAVNGPSLVVLASAIGGPVLPTGLPGTSPPFGQSTISTVATGPVGFETTTNIGTYTAPNFINMLYIIKT